MKDTAPPQRGFADHPALAERAVDLLRTPRALLQLTPAEAACVVGQMELSHFPPSATLIREGDGAAIDRMLLVLEGDVSVDTASDEAVGAVAISIVGPGSVLGEMALLDGAPRSASCTAVTAVAAAALSKQGLERLIDEHPRAAAKLLLGLAIRTGERLRALGEQLQIYAGIVEAKQAEIDRLRGGRQP